MSEKKIDTGLVDYLSEALKLGKMTVTFTKVDGCERVMVCTLNPPMITEAIGDSEESKNKREASESVMVVFDLEKKAWRSFRKDSIKDVTC